MRFCWCQQHGTVYRTVLSQNRPDSAINPPTNRNNIQHVTDVKKLLLNTNLYKRLMFVPSETQTLGSVKFGGFSADLR